MRRLIAIVVGVVSSWEVARAIACGCFTPPDPSVPIVQAGERLLFSRQDGVITATIQIQYQGSAEDFGWLLPLPSVPVLELSTDELFTRLVTATQPKYQLSVQYDDCKTGYEGGDHGGCGFGGGGSAKGSADAPVPDAKASDANGPAVVVASIGPYDYAVLRADDRREMLRWLEDNGYFVPVATDAAVANYIHPGGYFLALKLAGGRDAGDIQPVTVKYESDLPMIPIILTSVGATEDMGIQVWMLGQGRAIPRNYRHTVLDDAAIDWLSRGANYNAAVIAATKEAPQRHTFVTEYAGTSRVMADQLDPPGRFGNQAALARLVGIDAVVNYLNGSGYVYNAGYPTTLLSILSTYAPMPKAIVDRGVTAAQFYSNLSGYRYSPGVTLEDWNPIFDSAALAAEIWTRVAAPTLATGQLFRKYPYLTRLYTTLSPAQMTADPVFSENAHLPPVSNLHNATLTYVCNGDRLSTYTPYTLSTEQGHIVHFPGGPQSPPPQLPWSQVIETMSEEGNPVIDVDNSAAIQAILAGREAPASDSGGCRVARYRPTAAITLPLLAAAGWLLLRRRGRRRAAAGS